MIVASWIISVLEMMQSITLILISSAVARGFRVENFVDRSAFQYKFSTVQHLELRASARHRNAMPFRSYHLMQHVKTSNRFQLNGQANSSSSKENTSSLIFDYIDLMRPITIIQAVGAFLVGHLVIRRNSPIHTALSIHDATGLILASLSIYLSYGAGMAMNDCADAALDAGHGEKQSRSIASGRISRKQGWLFCVVLSLLSLLLSGLSAMQKSPSNDLGRLRFAIWNGFNLLLMTGYALGMQRIFLLKNFICGWLAVSPLVGASIFSGVSDSLNNSTIQKLYQLAAIGFPLQVSREILKDIEDIDTDRGKKQTLPLVIGATKSKQIAYGIVALINIAIIALPHYWQMFASRPPLHAFSVAVGVPMCIRASLLPLNEGQRLLKTSIYVLLLGMIGSLLLQGR